MQCFKQSYFKEQYFKATGYFEQKYRTQEINQSAAYHSQQVNSY